MSAIQKELSKATDVSPKTKEDRQEYLKRLMVAIGKLSDDDWEALSQEAQDWFNAAADLQNAQNKGKEKGKALPDFPDLEEEKEEQTSSRRRSSSKDDEPVEPKVGVVAKITTKRGKSMTGKIVEMDKEVIVLEMGDGSEEEFARDRIESIEVAGGEAKGKAKDEEPEDPVRVGAKVKVVTKRGKEYTGKIVELNDDIIAIETDDGEEEFNRDRVESIEPVGGKTEAAKTSTRRSSGDDKAGDKDDGAKNTRSRNPEGVSVGTRIKELLAEDHDMTEEEIGKALKKEGIEFKDNTLRMNFTDCSKFLAILKAAKKLK